MKIVTDFPHEITEDMDWGVLLSDGTRLSARLWRPVDALNTPVPAIVEYLPYRKSDGTMERDQLMHPYFAGHGYACVRVDRRGCGDSEGLFDDEYSEQELADGVEIITWIAAQLWCNGKVGIQGISWGGFNGLQLAARAPKPLAAVITIGSTVDRYHDDIHYKGGLQLAENIGWAATATSWNSAPPDPAIVGDTWRDIWLERLENMPFLARTWLQHPNRDDYWKHGSVCEDYGAIKIPVLTIGGLYDGYRNTMAHLLHHLEAPVKGIAGPWNHKYPMISGIGPQIGYLQEALRWWDHWLKGIDRGVEADPTYRAYVMDSVTPAVQQTHRPGRWVAEADWPSDNIDVVDLPLGDDTLGQATTFSRQVAPELSCGQAAGEYFPFGFGPGELPDDQRADDALSTCFDSEPMRQTTDILGMAHLDLRLSSDRPVGQVAVRLCDLRPDGASAFISHGFLNLRHRNGFEAKQDLIPGESFEVTIPLDHTAYRLPEGHRLRVAISSSYWPFVWPEAAPFTLTLTGGTLSLPTRHPAEADEWRFEPAETAPPRKTTTLRDGYERKSRDIDPATGVTTLTIEGCQGRTRDDISGLESERALLERWQIGADDPLSARAHIRWTRVMGRGDWQVKTVITADMHSDATHYHLRQRIEGYEGDERVFDQTTEDRVPRD